MRAMILAAGRGERMRPLTDHTPKPLLCVGGKPLIEYHLERLYRAGVREVVINHGRLGHLIEEHLGNGDRYHMRLMYSAEGDSPLETGGGIYRALGLLGKKPFIVLNADVWTDFDCSGLTIRDGSLAHLVLVNNPDHNPDGDFALDDGRAFNAGAVRYTFSGIGIYDPALFSECEPGRFPLTPVLRAAADRGYVDAELYTGFWRDVGTPERLEEIRRQYPE